MNKQCYHFEEKKKLKLEESNYMQTKYFKLKEKEYNNLKERKKH